MNVVDPQSLISTLGIAGVLAVVFAESGLLIGFFLPGDSLLFTVGLLIADGRYVHVPLWLACLLISIAAVAGDQVGYLFGKRVGPRIFSRPDSRFFKRENLVRAEDFFRRHGGRSIVLARFVPVVRTFTPIVAGASRMPYRTFVWFNILGGVLWGCGVTIAGYFLGQIAFVHNNVELILVAIVAISLLPIAIQFLRSRHHSKVG
ncbi:DedA family protein [Asanoa iriomotensis]|uniref:VTT domain-containing protein n=1 Tax=Asanoa iriomotensis TaxID=234613 RepID=A0ABQ4C275_9ACTN|nr:VTT domain-containing protein [Asanoa iriomotensis]GIF56395.1 hypothetical protein Air01nite_24900 [Asanoa iriomotensis]